VVDGTTDPGWQPLITDPERRAAISVVIAEIVAAVADWRRDHPTTSDDDSDYATLRIYTANR